MSVQALNDYWSFGHLYRSALKRGGVVCSHCDFRGFSSGKAAYSPGRPQLEVVFSVIRLLAVQSLYLAPRWVIPFPGPLCLILSSFQHGVECGVVGRPAELDGLATWFH